MNLNLWSAHSAGLSDCMRGDLALAMDFSGNGEDNGIRMLQVQGVSGAEKCRGILGSLATSFKAGSGKSFMEEEVLEPEKVTTFVAHLRDPKEPSPSDEAGSAKETGQAVSAPKSAAAPGARRPLGVSMVRYAQVGDLLILGTDPWASEAIREASLAREGSPPGGGGLVLADLGPFTQRPGVFGRMQMGSILRASLKNAKDSEQKEKLMEALEGPAGSIPFAMRFDEGAASLEFALPLAMFEAMAKSRPPRPAPPSMGAAAGQQGGDEDEGGEGGEP
jgi:hypothetical protein